jgi:signal transduction histidine kinase
VIAIDEGQRVVDPWLALLAGDQVWIDGDDEPDSRRRMASGTVAIALAGLVTLFWLAAADRFESERALQSAVWSAVVGTVAAGLLSISPVRALLGLRAVAARYFPRLLLRGACFATLVIVSALLLPSWLGLGAWALGTAVGADVLLSAWALGVTIQPLQLWRRFLTSPLHFGVVGAIVAVLVTTADGPSISSVVAPYLSLHFGLCVSVGTSAILLSLVRQTEVDLAEAHLTGEQVERRHRAHWLHDDVLAELRLTSLRVQSSQCSPEQTVGELEELDHRLRMRQLDDLYRTGPPRLADILQPHIRRAQTLGIRFTCMPALDVAGERVDATTGRLFGRAVSNLISNAINAGATTMAVSVRVQPEFIGLQVTDDAGGFAFDGVPIGRGLDQLAEELGRGNLERLVADNGSTMVARIPTGRSPAPPTPRKIDERHIS